jgi:hypothetical protein
MHAGLLHLRNTSLMFYQKVFYPRCYIEKLLETVIGLCDDVLVGFYDVMFDTDLICKAEIISNESCLYNSIQR